MVSKNIGRIKSGFRRLKETVIINKIKLQSRENLTLPDFICIGAQKAGTTWLMNNLNAHFEIYLPDVKPHYDIHFFDQHLSKGLHYYSNFFKAKENQITGENTPAYGFMGKKRIELVKDIMPNLKLILMVRDQKERAISHATMNLKSSYNKIPESELIRHFNLRGSRIRGDYISIVKDWSAYFRKEQILIVDFNRISTSPKEVLTELFSFLEITVEIDWDVFPFDVKFNTNPGINISQEINAELSKIYPMSHDEVLNKLESIMEGNSN